MSKFNIFRLFEKIKRSTSLAGGSHTFVNPYSYLLLRKNPHLLDGIDYIHCDGIALVFLMRIFGFSVPRMSFDGTSLAPVVFDDAQKRNKSIYFVGSLPGVAAKVVENVKLNFPEIDVMGYRSGFFASSAEYSDFLLELKNINPDILIVGMGTPAQEKFIVDLKLIGWSNTSYTCGGYLHQTAKKGSNYYPYFFDKFNCRWIYRIIDEPVLVKRYLFMYPFFLILFLFDLVRGYVNRFR